MTTVIKCCSDEKRQKKIDGFRKKLMIPESEILEYPELEVRLKIGNIFVNEKILEKDSVQIYKIDPYFCEHYKEWVRIHVISN